MDDTFWIKNIIADLQQLIKEYNAGLTRAHWVLEKYQDMLKKIEAQEQND